MVGASDKLSLVLPAFLQIGYIYIQLTKDKNVFTMATNIKSLSTSVVFESVILTKKYSGNLVVSEAGDVISGDVNCNNSAGGGYLGRVSIGYNNGPLFNVTEQVSGNSKVMIDDAIAIVAGVSQAAKAGTLDLGDL